MLKCLLGVRLVCRVRLYTVSGLRLEGQRANHWMTRWRSQEGGPAEELLHGRGSVAALLGTEC